MWRIPIIIFPPPPDVILWDAAWVPFVAYAIGVFCLITLIRIACERFCVWVSRKADPGIKALTRLECHDYSDEEIEGEDHSERQVEFTDMRRAW